MSKRTSSPPNKLIETDSVGGDSSVLTADSGLTPTIRDYLAQVYRLSSHLSVNSGTMGSGGLVSAAGTTPGYVSTSALADLLNVSAPAVNRMVTKLREMGLLDHEPYRGIALTPAGRREALKQLRRHRIVEAFLVNVMGFGWHEVHEEADHISRALTESIEARMASMAGDPTVCPHGEPIPAPDGTLIEPDDYLLTHAPEKQSACCSV